ncbi:MAG: Tex family protein [bacterium]|nr:Tex family protein [bacterium]MDY2649798.1 Tex family protein [Candidatus Egerieousia sp.]
MNKKYIAYLSSKMQLKNWQVEHCVQLLEEGSTVPFISRYRKEATGNLNEVEIAEIKHFQLLFEELEKRKAAVLKSIKEQQKLTPELEKEIEECVQLQQLEDIYLPYRPKRKTRASIAKERGFGPLAEGMLSLELPNFMEYAATFGAPAQEAIAGAKDIIAENIAERREIREELRGYYLRNAVVVSRKAKGAEEENEDEKYANYYSFSEKIAKIPAHRLLAVLRGQDEGALSVKLEADEEIIHKIMCRLFYNGRRCKSYALYQVLEETLRDAFKRLIHPSIEKEALKSAKERADIESIKVFGENLRQLLLAAPVGQKRTMAIDPGFRTGCKVVCLDAQGNLLHNETIYPHPPQNEKIVSMKRLSNMLEAYKIEVVAIGNGTAGRETEAFIKRIHFPQEVKVFSVSEDGASIYSASETAREEFPQYDVTVRGAVSIGRRLMDPLAELVKIDPKSLGVGQYQYDVDQSLLKEKLDEVVESCVNSVGVNLNTASRHLLSYVSGIGPALAKSIVEYRAENGAFKGREDLKRVKRLGGKAFEQAAGFLRIPDAANPLDNSSVHPERYALVEQMASDAGIALKELVGNKEMVERINLSAYLSDDVGMPTLNDIAAELAKPGRDPRSLAKVFEFSNDISTIEDLAEGMELPGIVTNITNFGAFVDIGIKQNGLVHVSQMSNKFISNPSEVLKLHQHVMVQVLSVDLKRSRIQLKLIS